MTPLYSIDGGATWVPLAGSIKICYQEIAADPEGEPLDLLVQITADELKIALICPEGLAVTYHDRNILNVVMDLP